MTGKTSAVLCAANKKAKSVTQHPDLPSGGVGDGSFIDFTSEDKDLIGAVVITAAGILHQVGWITIAKHLIVSIIYFMCFCAGSPLR